MGKAPEALPGALKLCGQLLVATGVLHCLAWIIGGWDSEAPRLIWFGVLYLLVGAGPYFRLPKVRYLALIATLIGAVGAYITIGGAPAAAWLVWLFIAIDLVVIVLLAASIWRGRQAG